MSRSRYAAWHYISAGATTLVTAVTGLVTTPLLIRWLGQEQLGAWRVALEWMGYVLLLEACMAPSLQAMLTRGVARDDVTEVRRVLSVGLRGYFMLTALMALAGCLLGAFISGLVGIDSRLGRPHLGMVPGARGAAARAAQHLQGPGGGAPARLLVNIALLFQGLLTTGLSVLFAYKGWGLKGQFIAGLVGQLPLPALLLSQGLRERRRTGLSLFRLEHDAGLWREFLALNSTIFVVTLCARLALQSDNIIASAVLGPAAVVPLIVTLRLVTLAQGQVQAIGNASWAALANLHARGEKALFGERLVELTRLTCLLGVAALGPIVVFNPVFISLWVGPALYGGHLLTAVGALVALMQAVFALWVWCFTSTGSVRQLVPMYLTATAINVAASFGCTVLFGPVGPVLGTLASFLTVNAWCLPSHLRATFGVLPRAVPRGAGAAGVGAGAHGGALPAPAGAAGDELGGAGGDDVAGRRDVARRGRPLRLRSRGAGAVARARTRLDAGARGLSRGARRLTDMRVAFDGRSLASPALRGWDRYTVGLVRGAGGARSGSVAVPPRAAAGARGARARARLPGGGRGGPGRAVVGAGRAAVGAAARRLRPLPRAHRVRRAAGGALPDGAHRPQCHPAQLREPRAAGPPARDGAGYTGVDFETRSFSSRYWMAQCRRASHVLTPSEFARSEVVEFLGLPPERVSTTLLAVHEHFRREPRPPEVREALLRRLGVRRPFVLYVGGYERHKTRRGCWRRSAGFERHGRTCRWCWWGRRRCRRS